MNLGLKLKFGSYVVMKFIVGDNCDLSKQYPLI